MLFIRLSRRSKLDNQIISKIASNVISLSNENTTYYCTKYYCHHYLFVFVPDKDRVQTLE